MQFFNTEQVPVPILRAMKDPSYIVDVEDHIKGIPPHELEKCEGRIISTTTLARSPRQRILEQRHKEEITVEPRDMWWIMLGKVVHSMLESHAEPGDIIEHRVGRMVDVVGIGPVYVHGQMDRITGPQSTEWYGPGKLNDWKWTKLAALGYDKSDYHMQVNVLAFLSNHNEFAQKIPVAPPYFDTYLLKDWDPKFYRGPEGDYPYNPWITSQADTWSEEEVLKYIRSRAFLHFNVEDENDNDLPFCTDRELWRSLPKFKIHRLGERGEVQPKAFKNSGTHSSHLEARQWVKDFGHKLDSKKKPYNFEIKEIPQKAMKCDFCRARPWCNQFKQEHSQSTEYEVEEMP